MACLPCRLCTCSPTRDKGNESVWFVTSKDQYEWMHGLNRYMSARLVVLCFQLALYYYTCDKLAFCEIEPQPHFITLDQSSIDESFHLPTQSHRSFHREHIVHIESVRGGPLAFRVLFLFQSQRLAPINHFHPPQTWSCLDATKLHPPVEIQSKKGIVR